MDVLQPRSDQGTVVQLVIIAGPFSTTSNRIIANIKRTFSIHDLEGIMLSTNPCLLCTTSTLGTMYYMYWRPSPKLKSNNKKAVTMGKRYKGKPNQ